jgi:diazepam-binding inhibitor (GABA receptor modulating acyl-CoA-binding protein)
MQTEFNTVAEAIKTINLGNLSNEQKLDLYKYYKQATEGDVKGSRPGIFSQKERAKWDAWNSVKGTSTADAQAKYIQTAKLHL